VWVPAHQTLTDHARAALPAQVPFADAVFNLGRTALLVAALVTGDVEALRDATADRLHQDTRLSRAAGSAAAIRAALDAGAWAAWLSGSGPSVAALCAPADAPRLLAAWPDGGRAMQLHIDADGAVVG
jgi:homoserine kinase